MGFGVVVPVVGGGVTERERERVSEEKLYNLYYFNLYYGKIKIEILGIL